VNAFFFDAFPFEYHTSNGYKIDFITEDRQGKYEIIQVVWDMSDYETVERETRALRQAEKELGFPGKLLDCTKYLQQFASDNVAK
jgi:hypothetical protein